MNIGVHMQTELDKANAILESYKQRTEFCQTQDTRMTDEECEAFLVVIRDNDRKLDALLG